MESLSYLLFLACPLMMVGAFIFLFFKGTTKKGQDPSDLQKNMNQLMQQNEQLAEEIGRLKNSR